MMKNAQSPKMSRILQIAADIWTLLGPIISTQNLLILLWVLWLGPKAKLEGFIWRQLELKKAHISATNCNKELRKGGLNGWRVAY